jgi:hypothetical protein
MRIGLELVWFMGAVATLAQAAPPVTPSAFHVVSVAFSNFGASFYYRVLDAKPEGEDTLVRYSRISRVNIYCPRVIVQSAEVRVSNTTPAQLAGGNNPCAVKPRDLAGALERYPAQGETSTAMSFGIAADCGGARVLLKLPVQQSVDMQRLQHARPAMGRLWDLSWDIVSRLFGEDDIFQDRPEDGYLALQYAAEKLVPELMSGRYDGALEAAHDGNVGKWDSPTFRALLADYRGPITLQDAAKSHVAELLTPAPESLLQFVAPAYPHVAKLARVMGKVELRVTLDRTTGAVTGATAISGHALLRPSATAAAAQWRFHPQSTATETVNVVLDYKQQCP